MLRKFRTDLDSLDLDVLERAIEAPLAAVAKNYTVDELEGDEELEAALQRELIEIARSNGVTVSDSLRDMFLATVSDQ